MYELHAEPFDRIGEKDVVLVDMYGRITHIVALEPMPDIAPFMKQCGAKITEKRKRMYWPVVAFVAGMAWMLGSVYVILR